MKHATLILVAIAMALMLTPAQGMAISQIDAILDNNLVVIGDTTFKIAKDAVFLDRDESTKLSFSDFKEGDWVEIDMTPEGQIDEMRMSSEP